MLDPRRTDLRSAYGDTHHHSHQSSELDRSGGSAVQRHPAPWLILVAIITVTSLTALHSRQALADNSAVNTATVNSPDGLNLRSGPATSFSVVAVMPAGATLTVTGNASADNWLPVQFNGQDGWADGVYLTLGAATVATPAPSPVATATMTAAMVQPADGLNLRSGPGTSFAAITVVPAGTAVTITGSANDVWVPVSVNGHSGWMNGTYLSAASGATVTVNSGSSSGGATLSAPVAASASPTTSTSAAGGAIQLAWPGPSRRISTVFSPSHLGIDIDEFPTSGRPLAASADGTVSFAGGVACCSYGLYVIIDHANGMQTLYAHLTTIAVKVGQVVKQGQNLGISGCTGRCTGPHIHYEVRVNGKQVDPLRYLPPPWNIE
ncbi:MAG: SH3 domain-containing protein [Dehalococcoidia bacterium]